MNLHASWLGRHATVLNFTAAMSGSAKTREVEGRPAPGLCQWNLHTNTYHRYYVLCKILPRSVWRAIFHCAGKAIHLLEGMFSIKRASPMFPQLWDQSHASFPARQFKYVIMYDTPRYVIENENENESEKEKASFKSWVYIRAHLGSLSYLYVYDPSFWEYAGEILMLSVYVINYNRSYW
jgi:hypothetical protein